MVPDQIGGAGRPVCTIPADAITGLGNAVMQILAGVADVVTLEAHSKAVRCPRQGSGRGWRRNLRYPSAGGGQRHARGARDGRVHAESGFSTREGLDELLIGAEGQGPATTRGRAMVAVSHGTTGWLGGLVVAAEEDRQGAHADAGVVLVLASERWIRKNGKKEAVYVDGVAWNSSLPWYDGGDPSSAEYASSSYARAGSEAGLKKDRGPSTSSSSTIPIPSSCCSICTRSRGAPPRRRRVALRGRGQRSTRRGGSLGVGNLLEASALHRLLESCCSSGARRAGCR